MFILSDNDLEEHLGNFFGNIHNHISKGKSPKPCEFVQLQILFYYHYALLEFKLSYSKFISSRYFFPHGISDCLKRDFCNLQEAEFLHSDTSKVTNTKCRFVSLQV